MNQPANDYEVNYQKQYEDTQIRQVAFRKEAETKTPSWAKAVIVAELIEDKSDLMSDYHGHGIKRTIILAFSKHKRDLFGEMRKAALNNPETAFLNGADKDAEHREKYSMGGGYYLKNEWRHDSGWSISKKPFYDMGDNVPMGEWSIPE